MLESEVYNPQKRSQDNRGDQDEDCRTLQFLPGRPGGLLGELYERLFAVIDKLLHLYI